MKKGKIISLIIVMIIVLCISGIGTYAVTTYVIKGSNIEYKDNFGLGVNNVQAAIDGTCSKIDKRLSDIENKDNLVVYSEPFTTLPDGYNASAYKLNGVVVLTVVIPAGTAGGWLSTNQFRLLEELRPNSNINGNYSFSSSSDANKASLLLASDGILKGFFTSNINYQMTAQFIYPVE